MPARTAWLCARRRWRSAARGCRWSSTGASQRSPGTPGCAGPSSPWRARWRRRDDRPRRRGKPLRCASDRTACAARPASAGAAAAAPGPHRRALVVRPPGSRARPGAAARPICSSRGRGHSNKVASSPRCPTAQARITSRWRGISAQRCPNRLSGMRSCLQSAKAGCPASAGSRTSTTRTAG
jgi:hypothetical protein